MAALKDKSTAAKKETTGKTASAVEETVAAKKAETPAAAKKTIEKVSAKKAVTEKNENEKKEAAKKPGRKPGRKPAVKTTAKSAAKKAAPVERVTEVHIQFYDREDIVTNDIVSKIEENFKAEGHRVSTIKSLNVYVNVAENKAYYVINGKEEGKFVEL